jgi:hypothetical protein
MAGPAKCPRGKFRRIKPGETLLELAKESGLFVGDFLLGNPCMDPARALPGQVVCMPQWEELGTGSNYEQLKEYIVSENNAPGSADIKKSALSAILQNDLPLYDFLIQNPEVVEEHECWEGYRLPKAYARDSSFFWHVVKPGEDIFAIAQRFKVSTVALMAANPRLAPSDFRQGMRVRVPRAGVI